MAALGIAALRRGGGAAPRLLAVAVSCQGCRPRSGPADGGHGQPREPLPGGRARRGAEPGPAAGGQPAPSGGADTRSYLWARYHEMKKLVYDLLPPGVCNLLNPAAIYANNEISLGDVEIYGFDYDYTLAQYSNLLHSMIFNTARDILIEQFKYPEGLGKYDYIPGFAIRGLHYDVQKSLLMKIDAFHYVQLGTAYRGLKPVPDEEVIELYGGTQHIPLYQMSDFYGKSAFPCDDDPAFPPSPKFTYRKYLLEEFLSSPTLPLPCEEGPVSLEAVKFDGVLNAGETSQGKGEKRGPP